VVGHLQRQNKESKTKAIKMEGRALTSLSNPFLTTIRLRATTSLSGMQRAYSEDMAGSKSNFEENQARAMRN
jgi:hypothetical protein